MANYVFLKKLGSDEGKIYVVSKDTIEDTPLHKLYDRYGQQVGHFHAGSVVRLLTAKAVELANKWDEDGGDYKIDDDIVACDKPLLVDYLTENLEDEVDIQIECPSIRAIEYFDGHNWRSISLEGGHGFEQEYAEIEDENELLLLNTVLEEMEFQSEGFGIKQFRAGDYTISQSLFHGDFAIYEIELNAY